MYCNKCGKPIDSSERFCPECKQQMAATVVPTTRYTPVVRGPSNRKGVSSMLLGIFALILEIVALSLTIADIAGLGVFVLIIATILTITSLSNGIKAIKNFSYARSRRLPKPTAGLVMGIIGIDLAAGCIFFSIYDWIVAIVWMVG